MIRFGDEVVAILRRRPAIGPLFPYLRTVRPEDRATEFRQRCAGLKIEGVTLHSYRYAWAERAKTVGYPERFAQEALGHNSKAVHRAERELRPLVIARKISFGSRSEQGAQTREILMSVLHTLRKRTHDVLAAFKRALDALAQDETRDPYKLLFDSS